MIEYEYKIVRDEKDKTRTLVPDKIPTQLDNLARIEGPNDSGKSTLLHIIALSLYGLRSKSIHQSLIWKMQNLLDPHQKLTFHVKITDKHGRFCIISEKKDPDRPEINVRKVVGDKSIPIIPERLNEELNLIYDIPADPTERLYELINDVKNIQKEYGQKISNVRSTIRTIITEIMNSQDPKRLANLKLELNELSKDKDGLAKGSENTTSLLHTLQDSVFYHYYHYYEQKCNEDEARLKELYKEINKKKRNKKVESQEYGDVRRLIGLELSDIIRLHISLTELLGKLLPREENHLRIWERIQISPDTFDTAVDGSLRTEKRYFMKLLADIQNKENDDERVNEIRLYQQLVAILED
ncbi:MAG: AAA family ATPase [Thaumarchaeota archaeon]|nr:AAA family ATPase [Nitrososphaerota archaeon]